MGAAAEVSGIRSVMTTRRAARSKQRGTRAAAMWHLPGDQYFGTSAPCIARASRLPQRVIHVVFAMLAACPLYPRNSPSQRTFHFGSDVPIAVIDKCRHRREAAERMGPYGWLPLLRLMNSFDLAMRQAVPPKRPSRTPKRRWASDFRQATALSSLTSVPPTVMLSSLPAGFMIQTRPRG